MPKAYIRESAMRAIAQDAAFRIVGTDDSEVEFTEAFQLAHNDVLEQLHEANAGVDVDDGAFPAMLPIQLKNGLVFVIPMHDFVVNRLERSIIKAPPGLGMALQGNLVRS